MTTSELARDLLAACKERNSEKTMALLDEVENLSDLNITDRYHCTMLHWACKLGMRKIALRLIEMGAEVNNRDGMQRTALHWACMYGLSEVAQAMLEKGADVRAKDRDNATALELACYHANGEVAMALIKNSTSAESTDVHANLLLACTMGLSDVALALLEVGAEVNIELQIFNEYQTPLIAALKMDLAEVALALIDKGAHVNFGKYISPLHLACAKRQGV